MKMFSSDLSGPVRCNRLLRGGTTLQLEEFM
jgi:hypothetical protein